uniref:Uncharacterized protein n=1 Tax=Ciona savignyi TaxID=51511 RepID=H2Z0X6_CIOSA
MVSPSSEQRCIGEPLRRIDHCDVRMRVMVEYPTHMTPDDTDERTHPSILGICYVPRSTGWRQLDEKVQLVFQEYCRKIDPIGGFGIHPDCVHAYTVGGAERIIGGEAPTLLPCGYIVGEVDTITLKLSELESVALDLLVDRDVLDRYTRLILEHGRVMICGPSGTGKSTLANRLAEHIVRNVPKRSSKCPIVHLDLKHASENEIRDYLHGVSENCSKPESSGREVPAVIVFDNLHRSSAVNEAFHPLL